MPDKVFTDWTEVGLEIVRETERLCGPNKSICDTQIGLRVFSPHVVSLTLIDLPGVTRKVLQKRELQILLRKCAISYIVISRVESARTEFQLATSLKT